MIIEAKLRSLGLALPDLDEIYRSNRSGARFLSHFAVQNLLYLSGTTPIKDGQPYLTGVVGQSLTLEQGYEAARYAVLHSLAAVKYALGDLDRIEHVVQLIGFVNSAPGFSDQPRVINGATDLLVELYARSNDEATGVLEESARGILTITSLAEESRPPAATGEHPH